MTKSGVILLDHTVRVRLVLIVDVFEASPAEEILLGLNLSTMCVGATPQTSFACEPSVVSNTANVARNAQVAVEAHYVNVVVHNVLIVDLLLANTAHDQIHRINDWIND